MVGNPFIYTKPLYFRHTDTHTIDSKRTKEDKESMRRNHLERERKRDIEKGREGGTTDRRKTEELVIDNV
jgi:hypothetical protein